MTDLPENEFIFRFPLYGLVGGKPPAQLLYGQPDGRIAIMIFTDEPGAVGFAQKVGCDTAMMPGVPELRAFCHGLPPDTIVTLDPLAPVKRPFPTIALARFLALIGDS